MKVLSLFDWISCARVALDRAGIPIDNYYASEVDKYAIQIAQKNYPDTMEVWSVVWYNHPWEIDLLIWWSPCQDLSIAKKDRQWLEWSKSSLFREYARILRDVKPKRFILENVSSMSKEAKETITREMWVDPIMINAALVSAQNRKRLFRTNIPWVTQPDDKGILLKDVLEWWCNEVRKDSRKYREWKPRCYEWKCPTLSANMWTAWWHIPIKLYAINTIDGKSLTIKSQYQKNWLANINHKTRAATFVWSDMGIRKLTPIECERLQCLPDNYTEWVSNSQRYKMLGNGFNVDVVSHILSFIPR